MMSQEPITYVIFAVAITFLQFPLMGTGVAGRIGDHAARHVMMELGQDSESAIIHCLVRAGNIV